MSTVSPVLTTGIPGIDLADHPAAPRPDELRLTTGPLFAGVAQAGDFVDLTRHRALWGEQPHLALPDLVAAAAHAGLRGAGGAGFPTDRKLASMAGRRVTAVVVNANEGEETSAKDGQLLCHVPHQVLDGAAAVASATGCGKVVIRLAAERAAVVAAVRRAVAERTETGLQWRVDAVPHRFVSGEATAVIRGLGGDTSLPQDLGLPPRDPRARVRRGSVFLSNVETFARLAQATRGHAPTSALVTVSGAVARPGVYEVPRTWTVADLMARVGLLEHPGIVVTGGWHGAWARWADLARVPLDRDAFASVDARWGAGVLVVLPTGVPLREVLAAIAARLAAESAGQCGPCVFGLPTVARELAAGGSAEHAMAEVDGRGLCAHPSATVAAVRSALAVIERGDT